MKPTKTLSDKNIEFLSPENTKESKFYLLSKIPQKGYTRQTDLLPVNYQPSISVSLFMPT